MVKGKGAKFKGISKLTDTFNRLKSCDSKQIANILVNAYNDGLLAVCGGLFEEKDVEECTVALWIAIGMLKGNNVNLNSKEKEDNHMVLKSNEEDFEFLKSHIGHHIICGSFGDDNVTIICDDCGEVICEMNRPKQEEE